MTKLFSPKQPPVEEDTYRLDFFSYIWDLPSKKAGLSCHSTRYQGLKKEPYDYVKSCEAPYFTYETSEEILTELLAFDKLYKAGYDKERDTFFAQAKDAIWGWPGKLITWNEGTEAAKAITVYRIGFLHMAWYQGGEFGQGGKYKPNASHLEVFVPPAEPCKYPEGDCQLEGAMIYGPYRPSLRAFWNDKTNGYDIRTKEQEEIVMRTLGDRARPTMEYQDSKSKQFQKGQFGTLIYGPYFGDLRYIWNDSLSCYVAVTAEEEKIVTERLGGSGRRYPTSEDVSRVWKGIPKDSTKTAWMPGKKFHTIVELWDENHQAYRITNAGMMSRYLLARADGDV